eukprot:SAG11_NODE_284_length_11240_cov_6.333812_3_plen_67_part_00
METGPQACWFKKGTIAKTAGGKLGAVLDDPVTEYKFVKLRLADGEESDLIKADSCYALRLFPIFDI